jgi:hypothetical protein
MDRWIHYILTKSHSLRLVNSFKIQCHHLVYMDAFCSSAYKCTKIKKCLGFHYYKLVTFDNIGNENYVVGSKDKLGPFSSHDTSRSNFIVPTKIKHMYLFLDLLSYLFVIKVACVIWWPHFFGHSWTTWPCSPQYKQKLFAHHYCCFICFMKGLNHVILHGIVFWWSYQGLGWQGVILI